MMWSIFLIPVVLYLLYLLERWIFNRYWDRRLSVELGFENEAVTEGDNARLKEVISNRNFIPLHILQVNFQTDPGLDFSETSNATVTDRVNVVDVFSLRFYEKVTRSLNMVCDKRGFYSILQTSLVASDIFNSDIHYATRDQRTCLYVYPRLLSDKDVQLPFKQLMGEVLSKRFIYEDTFTFRGIRDYTTTDPMANINWKASARTGDLKVNLHDYTSSPEMVLVLNVEEPGILYETELLENCIRMALTLAVKFISENVPVALLTNGKDKVSGEVIKLNAGASKDHIRNFSRALARIDLVHKDTASIEKVVDERLNSGIKDNATFCFISCSRRDEAVAAAKKLADLEGKLMWLCPLTRSMDQEPPGDRRINFVKMIYE